MSSSFLGHLHFKVVFIFDVIFIFDVVFIFEAVFIFEDVFFFEVILIFEVVFIFEIVFIFNVVFIFKVVFILRWSSFQSGTAQSSLNSKINRMSEPLPKACISTNKKPLKRNGNTY